MTEPTRDNLTEALFAPVAVRAYSATVDAALIDGLRIEEMPALAPMGLNRRAEFATARACARAALADLGVDAAVPKRDGGSPAWPTGMAGSISHTRGYCVAVASGARHLIGVDVEEIGRISAGVERRILVDPERAALSDLDSDVRQLQLATIFAAKEAFYKAHYEFEARYLGFDVIAVSLDGPHVSFAPGSGDVKSEVIGQAVGRSRVEHGRVIVGVSIDPGRLAVPLPSRA